MKLYELHSNNSQEFSPAFKAWFGHSKVVDSEGNPLVVYHATAADIKVFKVGGNDPTISGHAIWLTPSSEKQPANHNTRNREGFKSGVNVLPLYAKIERPLLINDQASLEWAQSIFADGSKEFPQVLPKQWVDEVTKDGEYDGIIFVGNAIWGGGNDKTEYIVFHPNQIKSALSNSGNYSTTNNDITESS
jgi:hypothetical protein